jgi:hypothetical protein
MPTHYFLCKCGKKHERTYSFEDGPPKSIPCTCGKRAKYQLIFPTVKFNGEGFTQSFR